MGTAGLDLLLSATAEGGEKQTGVWRKSLREASPGHGQSPRVPPHPIPKTEHFSFALQLERTDSPEQSPQRASFPSLILKEGTQAPAPCCKGVCSL